MNALFFNASTSYQIENEKCMIHDEVNESISAFVSLMAEYCVQIFMSAFMNHYYM